MNTRLVLRFFAPVLGATVLLLGMLLFLNDTASAFDTAVPSPEDGPQVIITHTVVMTYGDGLMVKNWDPGVLGKVLWIFPSPGRITVQGGWVGNAPLYYNGQIYPTYVISDEIFAQLHYTTSIVGAEDTTVWEPSLNEPYGSELGIWWEYLPPPTTVTRTHEISVGEGILIQESWTREERGILELRIPTTGTLEISGGWVFTAPLLVNGVEYTTTPRQGQAPEITPKIFEVQSNDFIRIEPSAMPWPNGTSELGLWYTFKLPPLPVHKVYIPIVFTPPPPPPPPTIRDVYITPMYTTQFHKVIVEGVEYGQVVEVIYHFSGGQDAHLVHGYLFGGALEATLNGTPLSLYVYHVPWELAAQIGEEPLPNPITLVLRTTGTGTGSVEIGLWIDYFPDA